MAELIDIRIPDEQEEGTTLELAGWLKEVGQSVAQHEPIAEVATDKAVIEIPAPAAGILRETLVEADDALEPGQVIGRLEVTDALSVDAASAAGPARPESADRGRPTMVATDARPEPAGAGRASSVSVGADRPSPHPAVQRYARKLGIDLDAIEGTGWDGRVTRVDLDQVLGRPRPAAIPMASTPERNEPVEGPSRRVRHDPMRRAIARNMADSVAVAPHVTAVFDCNLSAVIADRKARKDPLAEQGVKLTFTAYFVHAVAAAIRAVPEVNSRWHDDALEIFESIHVGVGTALEDRGLVVPVVRNVQDLDLDGIAAELTRLTEVARAGKLTSADMQGSTFTISNHGVMGTLIASPIIIRQPESAILGVGKVEDRAVVVDGAVTVQPMMYVTLTIDHRALDAFHTNRFLQTFCRVIETGGQS